MNKYYDLELSILSCLLQKPNLMNEVILDDKYFIKHKKIWLFMKSFYKRFNNFDLTLMVNISKNKYRMGEYIAWLIDQEPSISLFNEYQKQLIEEFNKNQNEKLIINKIYELSNDLFVGNINLQDFKNEFYKLDKKGE
jgi:hypothetical protein